MRRILIFVVLLFSSTLAFSQMEGDSDYSFGVRAYTDMALPKMLNQAGGRRYTNTYFSSYIVKFNDNLFSYRISGNYLHKDQQFANTCEGCQLAAGKVKDYGFKAGFEKNFGYSAIQPYLGIDFGYRYDQFKGVLSHQDQELPVEAAKRGFTISPVFGIKLSPVKAISIFAEANAEFFYAWGREESAAEESAAYQRHFKKGEYLYNPVAVGIQIHLGQTN